MKFQSEIDATHPMSDGAGDREGEADNLAMDLVGERHDKRDLVDLVRWLLLNSWATHVVKPVDATSTPVCCPFCRSNTLSQTEAQWISVGTNGNECSGDELIEHQCRNCGRSLWV